MAREELVSGLKNAVERGYSLERAKLSFISAGYPGAEVETAAGELESASPKDESMPIPTLSLARAVLPSSSSGPIGFQKERRSSGKWKIILLAAILVILLAMLGVTLFFREQVVAWVQNVLGW